jgi:hypothetical protein
METRFGGPERDAEGLGGLRQRELQVVAKDDDSTLVGVELL